MNKIRFSYSEHIFHPKNKITIKILLRQIKGYKYVDIFNSYIKKNK